MLWAQTKAELVRVSERSFLKDTTSASSAPSAAQQRRGKKHGIHSWLRLEELRERLFPLFLYPVSAVLLAEAERNPINPS